MTSSGSVYVTKWTRQAYKIGKAIDICNSESERESYVEEIYALVEHEGVIDQFINNNHHNAIIKELSQFNERIQKTTLQILLSMIRSNTNVKDRIRNDKSFIKELIEEISRIILLKLPQNYQYLNEICLDLLLELFEYSTNPYITKELENQLIDSIINCILPQSSQKSANYHISWTYLYALIGVLNSVSNKEGQATVERFIVTIMKQLFMKWKAFSNHQKLGIALCKLLLNYLDLSATDALLYSIIESNLEEVLIKLIFETHWEMTADYFLNSLKLFWRLLYFPSQSSITETDTTNQPTSWSTIEMAQALSNKQKRHVKQMINRYLPMICSSLLEKIKRYNNQEIVIYGFKIFHIALCIINDLDAIINDSHQNCWLQWLTECLSIEVNRLSMNEPDSFTSVCIKWTSKTLLELLTLNPTLIYDRNRNASNIPSNNLNTDPDSNLNNLRYQNNREGELNDSAAELTLKIIQIMYSKSLTHLSEEAFCFTIHLAALLSANSEKVQNKFLESNLHEMVIIISNDFIKSTSNDVAYEIRTYTSMFLTSLVLFNNPAKELMYHKDLQYSNTKEFLKSLGQHKALKHTNQFFKAASSYILFLASLAEFTPFNFSFKLGRDFDLSKFTNCSKCCNNVDVVEALQEYFIVLCTGESDDKLHLEVWSLKGWLTAAAALKDHYVIQKNMIVFLQLNAEYINNDKSDTKLLEDINSAIDRIIRRFPDSFVLLTEAIILIQILAKQIPEFATLCVKKRTNLDVVIFETITQARSKDLVNVAVHAFYMLTESDIRKVTMVKKAIKVSNIELLHCLLMIGAKIHNHSSKLFYRIIKTRPYEIGARMAQLLLNYGCIPTKTVVKQCIKENNFAVLNLLMCTYGVTQSDYGSILKWDDLNLVSVDLALINQVYNGIPEDAGTIELQRLCGKIKLESRNRIKLKKIAHLSGIIKYRKRYIEIKIRSLNINNDGITFQEKFRNSVTLTKTIKNKPETFATSLMSFGPISKSENPVSSDNPSNSGPLQQTIATQGHMTLSNRKRDKEDPKYVPVYGEVKEFFHLFRSGSNYSYNIIDPRCLLTKNVADEFMNDQYGSVPSYFGTRQDMDSYVKLITNTSFSECFASVSNSILASKTATKLSSQTSSNDEKDNRVTNLDLSRNKIDNLNVLSVSHPSCFIQAFTINLGLLSQMFHSLKELTLSENRIKTLPDSMFEILQNLAICKLDGNLLQEFPWLFFRYSKLTLLDLGNNKLSNISLPRYDLLESLNPESLGLLVKLMLQDNKLNNVDFRAFALFKNLRYLNLKHTNASFSQTYWFILPNVKEIILSDNNLAEINFDIFIQCPKLEIINLSNDKLAPLNDMFPIDMTQFVNLTTLDLSNNNLSCPKPYYIPKEILKLPNLENIRMSNNGLVEFPHMWQSLKIEKMDFSHNLITTLDWKAAKFNCLELTDLNLSYNRLKKLPPEIKNLTKLTYLDIGFNPSLSNLPPEIGLLRDKLKKLNLDGLKLRDLPNYLREANDALISKKILKYYYNKLKNSVPYNSLKLVVLGKKGRGKTSLLAALQGQNAQQIQAPNNQSVGIKSSLWKLPAKETDNQNVVYKLTCWEFLNQEEYFPSYEWFLFQRALYLIVFNVTCDKEAEIDSLKQYLLALKSRAPNAPILIVGTHFDKINEENQRNQKNFYRDYINKKFYPDQFPKINDLLTVDARRPNKSINNLTQSIIQVLQKHEIRKECLMGEKQPASFIRLEEILQTANENILPHYPILNEEQIQSLVIKPGLISNEDEFHEAVDFLSKCGNIVKFREHKHGLHNLYFISPQWLCEMIANVVSIKTFNTNFSPGVIKLSDIMDLLQNQRYRNVAAQLPDNVHIEKFAKQCLVILEKFDVVFQRNDNEILIPSRLDDAKPNLPNYSAREVKLRRYIVFAFLPAGFWPRLLTRLCALEKSLVVQHNATIYNVILWKKGLHMSFGNKNDTHSTSSSFSSMRLCSSLLLEGKLENGKEIIDLIVSRRTKLDMKIFVAIIDAIEVFVEEWYPGLTYTTVRGDYLMKAFAVCPNCNENKFSLDQLLYEISRMKTSDTINRNRQIDNYNNNSNNFENNNNNNNNNNNDNNNNSNSNKNDNKNIDNNNTVKCFKCSVTNADNSRIPFIHLIPDLVLGDLPDELILDPNELEIETTPDYCLGYGGHGQVYKGRYKGNICAVKYFKHMTNNLLKANRHRDNLPMDPIDRSGYKQLRQEVSILRLERNHPSLLALLAADSEKLILEYARLKDLYSVLQVQALDKLLQQRIAYQVLEGLQFLHGKSVLYRDLKPMNILMFDLSLHAKINAKLSDYGISRMMAPFGFINAAGTDGFQAPEVLDRLMTYGKSSDIFSFGITLFVMATQNHHPQELRQQWRPGVHRELISSFGVNNWPRMQDVIDKCLEIVPNDRPSIDILIDHIISPSFVAVEIVRPLTQKTRVQCSEAINCPTDGLEIIIVSGNELEQEIRCLNVFAGKSKGKSFTRQSNVAKVLTMIVEEEYAILGTLSGQLFTYDFHKNEELKRIFQLPSGIVYIAIMRPVSDIKIILIGSMDGKLYYQIGYNQLSDLRVELCTVYNISTDPISNICVYEDTGFITAGSKVYKIKYWLTRDIIEYTSVLDVTEENNSLIQCFRLVHDPITMLPDESNSTISFYVTLKDKPFVYHYDDTGSLLKTPINCKELICNQQNENTELSMYSYRVMSISTWKSTRYLAIGTASGHVIIVDHKLDLNTILHLYKSPKLILQHIKYTQNIESDSESPRTKKKSWLITIGNSYQSLTNSGEGATLLLIDDNVPKISREIDEHINKRK